MSSSPEENRTISRINGHLREADQLAEVLEGYADGKYMRLPEFFLQKADVKAKIGLLYEAQRANDIAELQVMLTMLERPELPSHMLRSDILEKLNPRMVEIMDGILNG